jgi:hypothetical protein
MMAGAIALAVYSVVVCHLVVRARLRAAPATLLSLVAWLIIAFGRSRRRPDLTPIRFSPSSLREGHWYEYLIRFALGGAATVFTGSVSSRYGVSIGGLFLVLPAIFCASRDADRET